MSVTTAVPSRLKASDGSRMAPRKSAFCRGARVTLACYPAAIFLSQAIPQAVVAAG